MRSVIALRNIWADAVRERNFQRILSVYNKDNVIFKGTLSDKVQYNINGVEKYFKKLLKEGTVTTVTFKNSKVVKLGDKFVESGDYNFAFSSQKGLLHANYQFIYELKNGKPLITSHFSSCKC